MKCTGPIAIATLALLIAATPCAGAETPVPPIITDIRTLFSLQDAAANGSGEAMGLQRHLLSQIRQRQPQDVARLPANRATAAMIAGYVLSGGNPELAEGLAKADGIDPSSRRLLEGAAYFMRDDAGKAGERFSTIEPAHLPLRIGGRVALAKAMLATQDAEARERYLAIAIALMPGTLVEESALRRSAASQAELGNAGLFWDRTDRYLRRFRNSPYAPEFMAQAVSRVVAFEAAGKPAGLPRFEQVMTRLALLERSAVYLQLAREAAARNLGPLTQFAARHLRGLSVEGSAGMLQADLYESLHDVAGPRFDEVVRRLEHIDAARLGEEDGMLLQAALAIARQIRAPGANPGEPIDLAAMENAARPEFAALIAKANAAMGRAGQLLEQSKQ